VPRRLHSRMPRLALFLVLLLAGSAAPAVAAQAPSAQTREPHLRVGDALPLVELSGLAQSEARSLAEYSGRVLLLHFVGYWSRPSQRSVPHVERLLAEYGSRGLCALALTDDDERKTHAWMRANEVDYAYAFDTTGELHRRVLFQRLPHAVLVDAFGTIVWTGNPLELMPALIERALQDVAETPAWTWPEPARNAAGALWEGRYADALAACADEGSAALVRARIAAAVAHFERLIASGEYRHAFTSAQRMHLGTLPEAAALAERVRTLLADKSIRRRAEHERELAELERRAEALRTVDETEALHKVVAAFVERHADDPIEPRARALLSTLEAALTRVEED
jgi:peroxiredoxin